MLDAARVDGCTDLGAFARVVAPISGPAIATVAILEFVGAWNEYFLALVLVRSETMRTVMTRIMGMILLAIAVEMTTTGLRAVFPGLA